MKGIRYRLICLALWVFTGTILAIQISDVSSAQNKEPYRQPVSPTQKTKNNTPGKPENQPWQLIRKLQHVQDAIASGEPGSLIVYRKLLIKYSGLMLAQNPEVWSANKNLAAAAVYVLVGGNPAVGIKAIKTSKLDDEAKRPLSAAIAYAERNFTEARKLMMMIDHTAIQPSAAAQFALAKSMVTASSNLELSSMYLNEARRMAPGTLIEEAALRRSFRIVKNNSDFEKFRRDASSYFRNFRRSLYFSDFLRNFAFGLMRMPIESEADVLKYLQMFSEQLSETEQLRVLVFTARSATVSGRVKIANWSSRRALEIMGQNDKLRSRLNLYSAASGIVQPEIYDASFIVYNKINRTILDKNDQKLFDAVGAIVRRLQRNPMEIAELKQILRSRQQTYPADEPSLPAGLENEELIIDKNEVVIRARELFAKLESISPE